MRLLKFASSTTGKLLVAALCVAATQAAVWKVQRSTRLLADQAAKFDVGALPLELGDRNQWSGTTTELDPRLFKQVGAITMTNRSYHNDAGRPAAVHLATFSTADMLVPHPPQLCLTESGWNILQDDWQSDGDRRYRLLIVEQEGARAVVVYWYQLGSDVAGDREDLRKIMQKFRREKTAWPPMVKVLIQIPVVYADADSIADCKDLGAAIFNWVRDASEVPASAGPLLRKLWLCPGGRRRFSAGRYRAGAARTRDWILECSKWPRGEFLYQSSRRAKTDWPGCSVPYPVYR